MRHTHLSLPRCLLAHPSSPSVVHHGSSLETLAMWLLLCVCVKLDDASGPSKPSAADEESIGSVSEDEEEVRHSSL